jgi:hypothetical protein
MAEKVRKPVEETPSMKYSIATQTTVSGGLYYLMDYNTIIEEGSRYVSVLSDWMSSDGDRPDRKVKK